MTSSVARHNRVVSQPQHRAFSLLPLVHSLTGDHARLPHDEDEEEVSSQLDEEIAGSSEQASIMEQQQLFETMVNEREPVKAISLVWSKVGTFIDAPRRNDFSCFREELPCIKNGEILIEALCWTVDHYMNVFKIPNGAVMIGEQVGSVIDSLHEDYPVLTLVVSSLGWRTHTIVNPNFTTVRKLADIGDLQPSLYLGTLGLPGLTAYFGLLELCQLKSGDTVLINAGAGSVGNVVGQIAKIKGCTVIAFAGSKKRCDWIRELGFDYVFNYSTVTVTSALKRVAPRGIDFYFDCVGAEFTESVLPHMNPDGTICMCGYLNSYGMQTPLSQREDPYRLIALKERQLCPISVFDFEARFDEAEKQLLEWVQQGKIKFREVTYNGFEKLPEALKALSDGDIVGKVVVKSALIYALETKDAEC